MRYSVYVSVIIIYVSVEISTSFFLIPFTFPISKLMHVICFYSSLAWMYCCDCYPEYPVVTCFLCGFVLHVYMEDLHYEARPVN